MLFGENLENYEKSYGDIDLILGLGYNAHKSYYAHFLQFDVNMIRWRFVRGKEKK